MDNIIINLIVLLGGGYLGYIFDRKILKRQEKYRASKELREAFIPALIELDPIDDTKEGYTHDTFSSNIVIKYFDKHKTAVYTFADYLKNKEKADFLKAWDEYAYPYKGLAREFSDSSFNKIPNFEYMSFNPAEEPEIREKLRVRIKKIISYGKFK